MALIYNAYFALSRNQGIISKGINTSAIFGFGKTPHNELKNEKTTHILKKVQYTF